MLTRKLLSVIDNIIVDVFKIICCSEPTDSFMVNVTVAQLPGHSWSTRFYSWGPPVPRMPPPPPPPPPRPCRRHCFFSPYGSRIVLVLPASNIFTKFRRDHPLRGNKYRRGINISRFSTNKSLYLADTRYRHSYYGRLVGTHIRSIKWCHFQ